MARIYKVKNTGADSNWIGQTILSGEYYVLTEQEHPKWIKSTTVFSDIASGVLVVNQGMDTIDDMTNVVKAWKWFEGDNTFPISDVDNMKIAVHASPKPSNVDGNIIYAIWLGAGDNLDTGEIGGGDLLDFELAPGTASVSIDVHFHENNGTVWLHEGYLRFNNGGAGDYINASVVAEGTPLQTAVNLDLIVDGTTILYSPSGPGTGTHGFADATAVNIVNRGFSLDGGWDYDGVNLLPNMSNTGEYGLSTAEQTVHRFMHKIPLRGTCNNYFNMSSEESTIVPNHYFLRLEAHNISDTTWTASVIVETYRERTFNP